MWMRRGVALPRVEVTSTAAVAARSSGMFHRAPGGRSRTPAPRKSARCCAGERGRPVVDRVLEAAQSGLTGCFGSELADVGPSPDSFC